MNFIDKLKKLKYKLSVKKHEYEYLYEYLYRWNKYHATEFRSKEKKYLRLRILIASHILEKGFSHNIYKAGFGRNVVEVLCKHLQKYEKLGGEDKFAINIAYQRLQRYHELNLQHGFDDSDYMPELSHYSENNGGTNDIILDNNNNFTSFSDYAKGRVSVRIYDQLSETIDKNEIISCIEIGQLAPNACNRQAIKTHFTCNKSVIEEFEKIHLGCNGFGHNAGALIIFTADLEMFEGSEIRFPGVDAGLFMMNFVYACQEKNLYSCILNGGFPGKANRKIRELMNIPSNEDIEGCVILYKLSDAIRIKVPESVRRESVEIYDYVE